MPKIIKKIVVFSGGNEGDGTYVALAENLGKNLALAGYTVVNGGGPGLMDVVARSVYKNNGEMIGVRLDYEGRVKSSYNTKTLSYKKILPRQQKIISLGDAFVVLPGGLGTLYEIVEVLAKKHLGEICFDVPVLLLSKKFWEPFNDIIKLQTNKKFMSQKISNSYKIVDSADEVLKELGNDNCDEAKQILEQKNRWNSRADNWDKDISSSEHYANFEDGYKKFIESEKKILDSMDSVPVAIDLGCGSGQTTAILTGKAKKIYILDIAEEMLKETNMKVPTAIPLHASVTEIPLPDQSVDLAISRGIVLSHLPEKYIGGFFGELGRITKSGGNVLFDYLSNPDTADYKNASPKISFTAKEITDRLEKEGFREICFDGKPENRVVRVSAKKV